jgi:hypothetical protein
MGGGVNVQTHVFLTFALTGDDWSASRPGSFTLRERASDTHFTGSENYRRFQAFTAVTMKNGVFWDITPRGSCNNRRFGGT